MKEEKSKNQVTKPKKILFTGGGTAGHIFPIISVIREIKKKYPKESVQIFYLGPKDDYSQFLLSQEGVVMKNIFAAKIRRYLNITSLFQNILDFLQAPLGFFQALYYIFIISPDIIFSKGGYGSFPVVLAGWLLLTPIFLHESDVFPGLANRIMSKLSAEIFVSFPIEKTEYFSPKKIISVGNPIRSEILGGDKIKAKELFHLTQQKPVILILGGSQGSQRINDVLLIILPELLKEFELIHQVGQNNFKEVEDEVKVVVSEELRKYYHSSPFLNEEELQSAYSVVELIVSRAGAGSIFEIAAVGKPSVLIPLPESAQNHQLKNAYTYAKSQACEVIEEVNLTPHFFLERVKYLFSQPERLKEMSNFAKAFSKPHAASIIAEYLMGYLAK